MRLELKPIAKDKRGESYSLMFPDGREAVLIFTLKGFYRGGHYHTTDEISLLLSGKVRCWKKFNPGSKGEQVFEKKAGDLLVNGAGEPHLTLALEDYWLLDWKPSAKFGDWESINYEPYRRKVAEQLV